MIDLHSLPHVLEIFYPLLLPQLEKERLEVAERDNANLLHKMRHIMHTHGYVDHRHTYQHHSLNATKRQRDQQQVSRENTVRQNYEWACNVTETLHLYRDKAPIQLIYDGNDS